MTNPSFEKEGGDSLQEFEESHRERKKTPQQKAHALREWAESHRGMNLPEVSDHVLNTESYYDDE